MPLPLSVKVTPEGSEPVSLRLGVGVPVVSTVKVPAAPSAKVVAATEVMAGACAVEVTVSVKLWLAGVPTPLLAVMVIGKVPPVDRGPGQGGRPVAVVGEGDPGGQGARFDAARRRVAGRGHLEGAGIPSVKVVLGVEVMAGAWSTVSVNDWVPLGLTPLLAVMVNG